MVRGPYSRIQSCYLGLLKYRFLVLLVPIAELVKAELWLNYSLTYIYNSYSLEFTMCIDEAGHLFHKWLLDTSSRKFNLGLLRTIQLKLISLI